jgi:beta-lactamase class A
VRIVKILLLFLICFSTILALVIFFFVISIKEKNGGQIISPIINSVSKSSHQVLSLFTKGVDQQIADSVAQSDGIYSVVVIDLRNDQTYSLNPDRTYNSASLYKLWVMAATYQALSEGKIKKTDVISDSIENLNKSFKIATEEAELKSGPIKTTVGDALEKTITVSDNYSALLLTKKLGLTKINLFLKKEQLTHSQTSLLPVTTASDIALFYFKLYNHQLVNYESSSEMIELLTRQAINDRIPKYLPKNISIAHKTGELDTVKHDAGIVFTPTGDFILVMLSDTDNPKIAAEKMAQLSQQIYLNFTSSH